MQRHPCITEGDAIRSIGETLECLGFFDTAAPTEGNIVFNISLDPLNPPTYEGRVLVWSGDGRVPDLGDDVKIRPQEGLTYPLTGKPVGGMIVGYFRAQALIGVQVLLEATGETVCFLGEQIDVAPTTPNHVVN